jgi:hypothetical protein
MAVHFDNATLYTAKCMINCLRANQLTRAPHPAFSPNLAPSDFCVFDKLKMALIGAAFDDNELLQSAMEVLNGISREELEVVFEELFLRLDGCIQQNGEYVE